MNLATMEDMNTAKVLFGHLSVYKDSPSLSDVIVVVENTEFHCHRLLLAAVSEFFAAAFRTDMKEAREGKITLMNVKAETFSTLLTCIYSGKYILNSNNLFELWSLSDMLQISFLLSQCEEFFDELLSVDNCVDLVCKVKDICLQAKSRALECVIDNFSAFRVTSEIYRLSLEELKYVVSSHNLKVDTEDEVLEVVFEWYFQQTKHSHFLDKDVDSGTEECQEKDIMTEHEQSLAEILECARYLLISESCLCRTLAQCTLSKSGLHLQAFSRKILDYRSRPHLHQTWCPPAAIHRENSQMVNVLLTCSPRNGMIKVLNPQNMEWGELLVPRSVSDNGITHIVCHNSKLYVFTKDQKVHTHYGGINKWHSVPFPKTGLLCDIDDSLYICKESKEDKIKLFKLNNFQRMFDGGSNQFRFEGIIEVSEGNLTNLTSTGSMLVIFFRNEKSNSYAISFCPQISAEFETLSSQLGSSSRLVTFRHYQEVFLLQENGCLWRIKHEHASLDLKITQELALWEGKISLNGAVLYNNQLMILGDFSKHAEAAEVLHVAVDGVFDSVIKVLCPETQKYKSESPGVILATIPKSFTNL